MTFIALTIAGSDSGGGAGIQADIKTMSALGVYGASVITALTAQNTMGVTAIHDVPANFVRAQMDAVFSDLSVNAVKIGMLSRPAIIHSVAEGLHAHKQTSVILDPVMVAESGDPLLTEDAVDSMISDLFPIVSLVTPNLQEAARLLSTTMAQSSDEMEEQASAILKLGAHAVLIKGGHAVGKDAAGKDAAGKDAADFLITSHGNRRWFSAPFVETKNTHGTGCSLSSAIAAGLARGQNLEISIDRAKNWLSKAIAYADILEIGAGAGPVHHFYDFWKPQQ